MVLGDARHDALLIAAHVPRSTPGRRPRRKRTTRRRPTARTTPSRPAPALAAAARPGHARRRAARAHGPVPHGRHRPARTAEEPRVPLGKPPQTHLLRCSQESDNPGSGHRESIFEFPSSHFKPWWCKTVQENYKIHLSKASVTNAITNCYERRTYERFSDNGNNSGGNSGRQWKNREIRKKLSFVRTFVTVA